MNPPDTTTSRALLLPSLILTAVVALTPGHLVQNTAHAQTTTRPCTPVKKGEKIPMDFKDVPIRDVTRMVGCALELNLVFSPPDLGDRRVTVFAPRPVPGDDLLRVLQSALRDASLILEKRGSYGVIRQAPKKVH